MKKILAILLALTMMLALAVPSFAADETKVAWEWSTSQLPKAAQSWGVWLFNDDGKANFYSAASTEGALICIETDKSWADMGYWNELTIKTRSNEYATTVKATGSTIDNGCLMTFDGDTLISDFETAGGTSSDWQIQIARASNAVDFNVTRVYVTVPVAPELVEITDIVFKSDVDFEPNSYTQPEDFTISLYSINGAVIDPEDQLEPYRISYSDELLGLYLEWCFDGDIYTGEVGNTDYSVTLITPNQVWKADSAYCYGDYHNDGNLNIDVVFYFTDNYLLESTDPEEPTDPDLVEITDIVFKSDVDFELDPFILPEGFTISLYSINGTVIDPEDQLEPYSISYKDRVDQTLYLDLEWCFDGNIYTGEAGNTDYNVTLITPNQVWEAATAYCRGDYYKDGNLNINIDFYFTDEYLLESNTIATNSGKVALSGFVVISNEYHAQIGVGGKSLIIVTPHEFDLNGDCICCGYHTNETDENVVEIIDPTEPSTEEEEDETVDAEPEEAPEENPKTGLALALVPMMLAAAAVVITKK